MRNIKRNQSVAALQTPKGEGRNHNVHPGAKASAERGLQALLSSLSNGSESGQETAPAASFDDRTGEKQGDDPQRFFALGEAWLHSLLLTSA